MAEEETSLFFLEFPDEVDACLREQPSGEDLLGSSTVIALNPATLAYLRRRGYDAEDTLLYLTPASRERAWERSSALNRWMREHFDFEDNWGVRAGYVENLVWYTRWVIHYLLWSLEILDNAVTKHEVNFIRAYVPESLDVSGPLTGSTERYFSAMAQRFALARGVQLRSFPIRTRSSLSTRAGNAVHSFTSALVTNSLMARMHRHQVAQFRDRGPILFTNQAYRMNVLADRLQQEHGALPVLLADWGNKRSFGWPIKMTVIPPFVSEARLPLLEPLAHEDKGSRRRLEGTIDSFAEEVSQATEVFSHLGISFADIIARKVRHGIGPSIIGLHKRAATIRMLLNTLRPSLVFANGSRIDDMITGELCRAAHIPSMMVTHGSHPPPSGEAEYYELGEHGRRIINAPYGFTALQSPVAEDFRKVFPTETEGVKTGPLIWAVAKDWGRSATLKDRMLGEHWEGRVIVHAGTPKAERDGMRFHVYETLDEYLQAIRDLVAAVEQVPEARVIVKFRPTPELSLEDLVTLVKFSEKSMVSVDEPLLDVLGFTDLLVSFSSTVIEEALQNRVPVLLYGGEGRYQHIRAPSVTEGDAPGVSPVYHVRQSRDLAYALRYILDGVGERQMSEDLFASYVYREEQVVPLPELLRTMTAGVPVRSGKGDQS